ncbi:conserved hypothetical protein [Paecilomyces variotii No. 5]|uniref:Uncharacterized protein n=1 Tax=Byssochlamys spectabilis (strain No. 5 / NBRC 109023) TaxID=1356009 RepID=V5FCW2_BYSSN|nr:conserved hypothetical protein [Paecilomyces variotii No. 5]
MNLKSRFHVSPKIGSSRPSKEKGKMKEKDSYEKGSRRRSITESVQSLVKHAFSRRDHVGSRNSSGRTAVNNEGKCISSGTAAASSSSWIKLPSPSDDKTSTSPASSTSSYYSSSSHITAVPTHEKEQEEIHEQETAQIALPETSSPLPSSDQPVTPLSLPKIRGKTNQHKEEPIRISAPYPSSSSEHSVKSSSSPKTRGKAGQKEGPSKIPVPSPSRSEPVSTSSSQAAKDPEKVVQQGEKPSRLPTATKFSAKAVNSSKGNQPQNSSPENMSVLGRPDGNKNPRAPVTIQGKETEGLFQMPLQRQENLNSKVNGKMFKGITSIAPKTNEASIQTSRLPRSSEHNAPCSPEKRATNMRKSLPASKTFSSGLSAQAPRRGSLPPGSIQKPSPAATRPLYGNRMVSAGKCSAVGSPGANATALATDRRQSNIRAASIPQRGLLAPLGPPIPRSHTFHSLAQSQKTKCIASVKGVMNKGSRVSDASDRTGHGQSQNGEEYAEVIEYLKATRPSRQEIEDKKQQGLWKAEVMSAIERDAASYEAESHIIDAAISATQNEESVYEAQETSWWAGRFRTLTSGFQYSDLFESPDPLTGIRTASKIPWPSRCSDRYLDDISTCRLFVLLEKMCATKEARESLRLFRDEYIYSYGDKWTGWLSDDYLRRWSLGRL